MCFFNSDEKAYLEQREAISTLKYFRCRKHFIQKLSQYSQGINVLEAPASITNAFLWEIHVFLPLDWIAYLEQNESFSTLKTMICRTYSFQKLTQFSRGKKVLDAAASSIHSCLCRGACVPWTQLNKPTWSKYSLSPPWNTVLAGSISSQN
jgi:hypothetical protein